jgi:hypothetical protein
MPDFRDEADEILALAHYVHMKILVWDPGDPGKKAPVAKKRAYQKRLHIRKELRQRYTTT